MDPVVATAGGVALLLFALGGGKKKKKGCPPFEYDAAKVQLAIGSAMASGIRSHVAIATTVARATWPVHPKSKQPIVWPPVQGSPKEVVCVWEMLLAQISSDRTPCPEGTTLSEDGERCDPDVTVHGFDVTPYETPPESDYPTPGTLVQIRKDDILEGTASANNKSKHAERSIAYTTLLSAGYIAARDAGEDDAAAKQFARLVANNASNRHDYFQLIQCSPWNDALYTTYGYGPQAMPSPVGRALRFLPQHDDNRARIIMGQAPRRATKLGAPSDQKKGNGSGTGRSFEYLWLPKINLEILFKSGGTTITTQGVSWDDGSNGIMPPPEILQFGVDNVPNSVSWGCLGYSATSGDME